MTLATRRSLLALALQDNKVERYVRFRAAANSRPQWGRLENNQDSAQILELTAAPYLPASRANGKKHALNKVTLCAPCEPGTVFAVGLNYKSHLGTRPAPPQPEIFYKPVACLQDPDKPIIHPSDSKNLHYEGELVIVLSRGGRNLTVAQGRDAIYGVTCGNDVSERDWQNGPQKDLQWWRAKGADTFGPAGPYLVRGLDPGKLQLETRLNGQTVQKQTTADLLFDCPTIVSYISRYVTLAVGDIIYTGTPGSTKPMKPGDIVEVELSGVGILRNPVKAA